MQIDEKVKGKKTRLKIKYIYAKKVDMLSIRLAFSPDEKGLNNNMLIQQNKYDANMSLYSNSKSF